MYKKAGFIIIFCLVALNFNFLPVSGADFSADLYKSSEILVKFRNDSKIHKILLENESVEHALIRYRAMEDVEFAEPNYFLKAKLEPVTPLDSDFGKQWYLEKTKAPWAWAKTTGSENVVIAVLDTGLDLDHPDIAPNLYVNEKEIPEDGIDNDGNIYVDDVHGWDFVDGDNDPNPNFEEWYTRDGINHGTVVAGVAAAVGNNNEGIAGISWHSKIMPLRVLDSMGSGDVLTVIEAIDYAIEQKVDVINLSFVGIGFSKSLFLSLERAYSAGAVVVAAAGNEENHGQDLDVLPSYPVCYYGQEGQNIVLGVAALDKDDKKTSYSNYGSKCVDISAPGKDFWSTQVQTDEVAGFENYYGNGWSGTSVSTPLVSGAAALIKSLNPMLSAGEIRDLIIVNADSIDALNPDYAGKLGRGRLNIERSIEAAYLTREMIQEKSGEEFILTAPFKNYSPLVKILREDGSFVKSFNAYNEKFLGGVNIASGDLNGDGTNEIITGAGPGGGPHVRIFKSDGTPVGGFFAYDATLRNGVNVAVGDLDGDGKGEIITGPGKGSAPEIKAFDLKGFLKERFLIFAPDFFGGVNVASGDTDGDGKDEIIAGQATDGSQIRIFGQYLVLKSEFFAFSDFSGGVNVASGDLDGDGKAEIIVGAGQGGSPRVKIFNMKGLLRSEFLAYESDYSDGVKVSPLVGQKP